jgi:hypothetical protein
MAAKSPVTLRLQAAATTPVIAAPGPGSQLVVQRGSLHHRNANPVVVSLQASGVGNAPVFTVSLTAQDSAAVFEFGDGWVLPENTALQAVLSLATGAVDVDINVSAFYETEV